ncbi:50S ribosomal protein L3 [Nitrosomonas marina]|uniref:Large ribosomal subunit protein uL3 n=1 Tax=Nitrosomonas marina TaxID=917 RepID=A0A1H8ETU1_9PROT|nr:50S ribosomal protein L3 [Nitrosomonas marina]SEN22786.1 LSU ribosomal protein L3P [Nitrosomonas marina]
MSLGLIGRKIGMTRIFTENGDSLPVTVVDVAQNRVTQIKSRDKDGYTAIQLTYGKRRAVRVNKPQTGHYSKAGTEAGELIKEFRIDSDDELSQFENGSNIEIDIFQEGQKVDISGITIGKGYAGTIKRHNFSANRTTHGNSKAHRKPGSIGMAQDPGRIFPGKRMSGQMGNVKRTIQNLEIVKVDKGRNLLLIKGALPGSKGGKVIIRPSIKLNSNVEK